MTRITTLKATNSDPINRVYLDEAGTRRSVEEAFESFAVMLWQMAQVQDSASGWARICEHLYTIRLFLDRLGLPHLAESSSDLMSLANWRSEMGSGRGGLTRSIGANRLASRPRVF